MPESYLQDKFLRVFAENHQAAVRHAMGKIGALDIPQALRDQVSEIVRDEIRGLYHGNLVVLDNGSKLADHGMIKIVDDEGTPFISYLHEICFHYFDENAK